MYRSHLAKYALVVAAACSLAFVPRTDYAQYGRDFHSIEWCVAQSETVVRGEVSDVKFEPLKKGWGWVSVTLRVEETIKGPIVPKVEFATWSDGADDVVERWKKSRREVLWFLTRDKNKKSELEAESGLSPVPREWVPAIGQHRIELAKLRSERLDHSEPAVFLMDLTVREKPEEILAAARKAVQEQGSKPPLRSHQVAISRAIAMQTGSAGDANSLTVPVVGRLETIARRWITEPGKVVDLLDVGQVKDTTQRDRWLANERDQLRERGVIALKYFPSDESILLLRGLLNDPAWSYWTRKSGDGREVTRKVFFVRKAAYEVLKKWEVSVERPHISEPAPTDVTINGRTLTKPKSETVGSSEDWRGRAVQSDGVSMYVAVPAAIAPEHLPLQLVLANKGNEFFQATGTGYFLDCKIRLKAESGEIWKYTRYGDSVIGERPNGGSSGIFVLKPASTRHWQIDLADFYEPLKPGKYRLTLEAGVRCRNEGSGDFTDTKTMVAKDILFQVNNPSGNR